MATQTKAQKAECLNPNSGNKINIDQSIYDLFSKAIYHTLKAGQPLSYTDMVKGVNDCFKKQKTKFDGSVGWYAVTVKNDMEARGIIEIATENGKKMHRLKK